jgi:hypothetical protein
MVPINAAPNNPIKPVYKTPDFDEPEPGNSAITSGTVIGANVVVVVVEVVDVVVVVSGATVVAGGMYFFFATVVVVVEVVVVVGIATLATIESDVAFIDSGNATYPAGNAA